MPDYPHLILASILAGVAFLTVFYGALYLFLRAISYLDDRYWKQQEISPEDREDLLAKLELTMEHLKGRDK